MRDDRHVMNAGLSVLIPLLIMFFALSLERVEHRLCERPRPEQAEELLASRVHLDSSR